MADLVQARVVGGASEKSLVATARSEWGRLALAAAFSFVVVLLVGVCAALAPAMSAGSVMSVPRGMVVVAVRPGDTLWALARRFAPGSDPRTVVDEIMRVNGLGSAGAPVGASLLVPAENG